MRGLITAVGFGGARLSFDRCRAAISGRAAGSRTGRGRSREQPRLALELATRRLHEVTHRDRPAPSSTASSAAVRAVPTMPAPVRSSFASASEVDISADRRLGSAACQMRARSSTWAVENAGHVEAAQEGRVDVVAKVAGQDDQSRVILEALKQIGSPPGWRNGRRRGRPRRALAEERVGLVEEQDRMALFGLAERRLEVLLRLADPLRHHAGEVDLQQAQESSAPPTSAASVFPSPNRR